MTIEKRVDMTDGSAPAFTRGGGITELATQAVLIAAAVLFYFGVRGRTEGAEALAVGNAKRLLRLEQRLGVAVERQAQELMSDSAALTTLANWVYIWAHWPVIIATLIWLFRCHRYEYLVLRNALFVSGAIGLVVFAYFPVAPPRLTDPGFIDTVTELSSSYRILQPPSLVNQYAALPSLHVGWNLLVGIAILRVSPAAPLRTFAVVGPAAMTLAVILTANHYVLDVVAGVAVSLVGLAISSVITLPAARFFRFGAQKKRPEIVENHAIDLRHRQPQSEAVPIASTIGATTSHESPRQSEDRS